MFGVYLEKSHLTHNFSDCIEMKPDDPTYLLMKKYNPNKMTPMVYVPAGMGHFGVIVKDQNDNYHSIVMGGSNDWERLENLLAFSLYRFNEPSGKVSDLCDDTKITFNYATMNKPTSRIYGYLIKDDIKSLTFDEIHTLFMNKLKEFQ